MLYNYSGSGDFRSKLTRKRAGSVFQSKFASDWVRARNICRWLGLAKTDPLPSPSTASIQSDSISSGNSPLQKTILGELVHILSQKASQRMNANLGMFPLNQTTELQLFGHFILTGSSWARALLILDFLFQIHSTLSFSPWFGLQSGGFLAILRRSADIGAGVANRHPS